MKIIATLSGGKDSTATMLLAIKLYGKENVKPLFNDTGWENPLTYEYLNYLEEKTGVEINRTHGFKNAPTIIDLIRNRGKFPGNTTRYCTERLKTASTRVWIQNNVVPDKEKHELWLGLRTDESSQRAKRYAGISAEDELELEDIFPGRYNKSIRNLVKARLPIISWSTEDVFDFIHSEGFKHNPLYDEGTNDRVGCYPCFLAGKRATERMLTTEFGKKQLAIISGLEKELGIEYTQMTPEAELCFMCSI